MSVIRWARRSAVLLYGTTLAVAAVGLALLVWDWSTPVPAGFFGVRGFSGLWAVSFGGVGALLTWRRPGHLVGRLFAAAGMVAAVDFASFEYALAAADGHRGLPAGAYVGWLQLWIWVPFVALITVYLFLLFPAGRLAGPRGRLLAWVAGGFVIIAITALALIPGPDRPNLPALRNPFGIDPAAVPFTATVAGLAGLVGCAVLAAWSLFARSRRGTSVERQQIKWLAYSGCLVATFLVPSVSLSLTPGLAARIAQGALMAAVLTMPAAVAVAVLRYRLYDLDVVVRKTVVAALVTAAFTAIYALAVAAAGAVTGRPGASPLTFAAAALAALLLQPVRTRAGHLADRLVYGRRASPYEVLSEFSGQVAGFYSVADVLPRMAAMLGEATGAERAEVWMRTAGTERLAAEWPARAPPAAPPGPAAAPDSEPRVAPLIAPAALALPAPADPVPDGRTRVFGVEHQGERLGSLRVTSSLREPLTPAGERLVQAVAAQAGLVLRNVALVADLRASRLRLVAAADEARRGLERDLHDGAQQQLVALRITLSLARQVVQSSPDEAAGLLAQTERAAAEALEELRDLARGIYPPLLADLGLGAALQAQARKAPLPVTVEADGTGRYPQDIEAALYFAILEALQNVAKYAHASAARVTLRHDGQLLVFTVGDDGTGFDQAKTSLGTGIQGMADRMAALGGTLKITSAPGHGTEVTGQIPAAERRNS
ncbi:MAG: histidine kinase [Streptosporangiaceae bacterium]|jgi:signal transduction histidine kinase